MVRAASVADSGTAMVQRISSTITGGASLPAAIPPSRSTSRELWAPNASRAVRTKCRRREAVRLSPSDPPSPSPIAVSSSRTALWSSSPASAQLQSARVMSSGPRSGGRWAPRSSRGSSARNGACRSTCTTSGSVQLSRKRQSTSLKTPADNASSEVSESPTSCARASFAPRSCARFILLLKNTAPQHTTPKRQRNGWTKRPSRAAPDERQVLCWPTVKVFGERLELALDFALGVGRPVRTIAGTLGRMQPRCQQKSCEECKPRCREKSCDLHPLPCAIEG